MYRTWRGQAAPRLARPTPSSPKVDGRPARLHTTAEYDWAGEPASLQPGCERAAGNSQTMRSRRNMRRCHRLIESVVQQRAELGGEPILERCEHARTQIRHKASLEDGKRADSSQWLDLPAIGCIACRFGACCCRKWALSQHSSTLYCGSVLPSKIRSF